jgi:hypothetical protein
MSSDERLDLEFAYTSFRDSRQDFCSPTTCAADLAGHWAPTPPATEPNACAGRPTSNHPPPIRVEP